MEEALDLSSDSILNNNNPGNEQRNHWLQLFQETRRHPKLITKNIHLTVACTSTIMIRASSVSEMITWTPRFLVLAAATLFFFFTRCTYTHLGVHSVRLTPPVHLVPMSRYC